MYYQIDNHLINLHEQLKSMIEDFLRRIENNQKLSKNSKRIFRQYIIDMYKARYAPSVIKQSYNHISTFLTQTGVEADNFDRDIFEAYLEGRSLAWTTKESYRYHVGRFHGYAMQGRSVTGAGHWKIEQGNYYYTPEERNRIAERRAKEACFIATAAYGTPWASDMDVLRRWRDQELRTTIHGRTFIRIYYFVSPPIADILRKSIIMRTTARTIIQAFVKTRRHL